MSVRYHQQYDGDEIFPVMAGYKTQCCDCGLTHVFDFRVVTVGKTPRVLFTVRRDERATAAARRERRKRSHG